jgi:hypothetical protein
VINENSKQQCRNNVYAIVVEKMDGDEVSEFGLCRLHFSFNLNDADFRKKQFAPVNPEDQSDMEVLISLHDKSTKEIKHRK